MTTAIISVVECGKASGIFNVYVHDNQSICTRESFNYGLNGEVGNPLVSRSNQLVGIASYFAESKGKPDIFTSVLPFTKWITGLIENTRPFIDN